MRERVVIQATNTGNFWIQAANDDCWGMAMEMVKNLETNFVKRRFSLVRHMSSRRRVIRIWAK